MSEVPHYDALIIGSGIGGLTVALEIAEQGLSVALINRDSSQTECNTYWAQGGIIFPEKGKDEEDSLKNDILKASSQTAYLPAVELLVQNAAQAVEKILVEKADVPFERDENGLKKTKEAAHSRNRIAYRGDFTGKAILESLLARLKSPEVSRNIHILEQHTAIDLITPKHHGVAISQRSEQAKVLGAFVFDQRNKTVKKIVAKTTVLATGGIGALYLHNTNSAGARGDGHSMAARAGAELINMEFIQFHPTAFFSKSAHRRFLISEALRGEGGRLINWAGKDFMASVHPNGAMAPRDVVSRAIVEEMIKTKEDCVFLDMTHLSKDFLQTRFPTIYQYCLDHKVEMSSQPIPVVPAAHYSCGGVKTDLNGQTNLGNLYAVGEVACTGLHGANRLASTSLLEGLVWAEQISKNILSEIQDKEVYPAQQIRDWEEGTQDIDLSLVAQDWSTLKQTMWNYLGIKRSRNRLGRAKAMLSELGQEIGKFYKHAALHDELIGLRNAVEVSSMVLRASQQTQTSVGCFFLEKD